MKRVPRLPGYYTTTEVAEKMKTTKQNVHKMIEAGRFSGTCRIGDGKPIYLIPKEAVEAEIARRRSKARGIQVLRS